MTSEDQASADVDWLDAETPRSRRFDDIYFASSDGQAETRHVFLSGNDLPARWRACDMFTIAELGFGFGLNFLVTWAAWSAEPDRGARLEYVGFEIAPPGAGDIRRAITRWPDLAPFCGRLLESWPPAPGWNARDFGGVTLRLGMGDANRLLSEWPGAADAWFLDGFSPAKNPELWNARLLGETFEHTAPGGTFATYAAAGWVRRNLQEAGYMVEKAPGFAAKREMLLGRRRP